MTGDKVSESSLCKCYLKLWTWKRSPRKRVDRGFKTEPSLERWRMQRALGISGQITGNDIRKQWPE